MSAQSKLEEFIRRLIQKELKEASSTASAGDISYKTPYAFKKNKKGKMTLAAQNKQNEKRGPL